MIWKIITFLGIALLALSDARAPISKQSVIIENYEKRSHVEPQKPEHHEVYAWAYPSYEFKYEVADPHTHDFKGHHETRHGDEVNGKYWLIQPDGYKRTVKYHADKSSGFKANVDYNKQYDKLEENNEENEESASVEEENSNEENSSVENENSNNEEESANESDNNKNELDEDNGGESASLGEQSENESSDVGRGNGVEESNDDENDSEENEQEARASKYNENPEAENEQESGENIERDNGNEESSAAENKKERHVVKHEYHFIIHHPKFIRH